MCLCNIGREGSECIGWYGNKERAQGMEVSLTAGKAHLGATRGSLKRKEKTPDAQVCL